MRVLPLVLGAIACQATGASSSAAQDLQPGQRVRVTAPSVWVARQVLVYDGMVGDSLRLLVPPGGRTGLATGSVVRVPTAVVTRLEVRHGNVSPGRRAVAWGVGALILGAAFVVADAVTPAVERCTAQESVFCGRAVGDAAGNALVYVAVLGAGGAISALTVRLIAAERWHGVARDRWHLTAGAVPGAGGGLTVLLRLTY
jgi:hypothetical protein